MIILHHSMTGFYGQMSSMSTRNMVMELLCPLFSLTPEGSVWSFICACCPWLDCGMEGAWHLHAHRKGREQGRRQLDKEARHCA